MGSQILEDLANNIEKSLVANLLTEYKAIKNSQLSNQWSTSLVHAGKFSELVLAIIRFLYEGSIPDMNQIHFEDYYNNLTNRPKNSPQDEILLIAIPKAASTIYTIRNKKRVVHFKSINPDQLDSLLAVSLADWILSQIILFKTTSTPSEVYEFIQSLIERRIPAVQEFEDGSLVVLDPSLPFRDQLMLILYHLAKRVSDKELLTRTETYPQHLNSTLRRLHEKRLVHRNPNGSTLSRTGIQYVESKILPLTT